MCLSSGHIVLVWFFACKKNGLFFCTKHAKKEDYQLPIKDLKPAVIKKASLQKLKNIINNYILFIICFLKFHVVIDCVLVVHTCLTLEIAIS